MEVVKDSHPSYPYHVKIKNNKKPILHLLKTRDNGSKVFTLKSGKSFKVGNVSVMSGSFNEGYIREQKGKGITANEIARKGFENDISESDMRQFAQENNISLEEMNIAIDNYKKEQRIPKPKGPSVTYIRKKSNQAILDKKKKKTFKYYKQKVREKILDRQTRIKGLLKGIGDKNSLKATNLLITKAGAGGNANLRVKEAKKKIFDKLS